MNPGRFLREVLESHEFRPSDTLFMGLCVISEAYSFTSDNANLSDIMAKDRVRRFLCYFLEKSAAMV